MVIYNDHSDSIGTRAMNERVLGISASHFKAKPRPVQGSRGASLQQGGDHPPGQADRRADAVQTSGAGPVRLHERIGRHSAPLRPDRTHPRGHSRSRVGRRPLLTPWCCLIPARSSGWSRMPRSTGWRELRSDPSPAVIRCWFPRCRPGRSGCSRIGRTPGSASAHRPCCGSRPCWPSLTPLAPDAAIEAGALPGTLHRDPADRLLIATARDLGVPLVTRDARILAYAAQGHLDAIPC